MKKFVVTGATSFIGVHLIERLLEEECIIYAVIRPNSSNAYRLPVSDRVKVIELDLSQITDLLNYIPENDVDAFYHLAWEGARAPYRDDKELQNRNYECAMKAANISIKLGTKLFVGSGSQAEYGKFNGKVDETYPCAPITEYGKAKYKAYLDIKELMNKNGIRFIWTRIFSVFGKYDYSGTLIMSSLKKMLSNMPIDMTACTQMWDFISVEDVADAFVKFSAEKCENGVYNIASGDAKPLHVFVEDMKRITKSESTLNFGVVPYGKEGPVSFEPVVDKLKNELKWKPNISFEDGIKKLISDEEANEKDKYINTNI